MLVCSQTNTNLFSESNVYTFKGHYCTPHHTTPHYTTPHHTTPHYTTPHYTTPHHTTPHHTTPHHTTPHWFTNLYLFSLWKVPSALVPGLVKGELPALRVPWPDGLRGVLLALVGITCRTTPSSLNPGDCHISARENCPPPLPSPSKPLSVGLPRRVGSVGWALCGTGVS